MQSIPPGAQALFPLDRPDAAQPGRPPGAAAASPLSPHEVLLLLWRYRWLIGFCVLLLSGLAVVVLKLQPQVYSSTARVWVQTEQQGTPSFLSGIAAYRESQYAESTNRKIETEMELMLTHSSADNVVARLGLKREQFGLTPLSRLRASLRDAVDGLFGRTKKPVDPLLLPSVGDLFLETVTVQPLRSKTAETASNVLEVRIESADAALAPKALAALLDNYLGVGAQQTQKLGEATARLLQTRLAEARGELQRFDEQLVSLALRDSGRAEAVVIAAERPTAVPRAPLDGGLRMELALDASRAGNAQAVSQLKSQTLELQARLDELRQVYTDDADNVRGLRRRIDASRARLSSSVRAGVKAEAEFTRLERQRSLAQDRFVELQKKLDQIELYLQLNPTAVDSRVVVDPPSAAKPVAGKSKLLLAALGPVLGLLLGLLLAGLRELFDSRLRDPAEVERALGLPTLVAIPRLPASERERWLGSAGVRA